MVRYYSIHGGVTASGVLIPQETHEVGWRRAAAAVAPHLPPFLEGKSPQDKVLKPKGKNHNRNYEVKLGGREIGGSSTFAYSGWQ